MGGTGPITFIYNARLRIYIDVAPTLHLNNEHMLVRSKMKIAWADTLLVIDKSFLRH